MKIALLFLSPNQTTKAASEKLQELILQEGHQVILLNIGEGSNREDKKVDLSLLEEVNLIGIGAPVYHLTIAEPMEHFLNFSLSKIKKINPNIRAFFYFTYSGITTGKAFYQGARLLEENDIPLVGAAKIKAPHFREASSYPDEEDQEVLETYWEKLSKKNFSDMDWKAVYKLFGQQKMIVKMLYPFAKKIGKRREQRITILPEKCTACKKCARECPVEGIQVASHAIIDTKKCMHCYHCVITCPKKAIYCDIDKVYKVIALNKKIVGMESPPNEIFV